MEVFHDSISKSEGSQLGIGLFLRHLLAKLKPFELMFVQKNSYCFLKEGYSFVKVKYIEHFDDCRSQRYSPLFHWPVRLKRSGGQDSEKALLYIANKGDSSGVIAVIVILCELHFIVEPHVHTQEEEEGQQRAEDTSHVSQSVKQLQVCSGVGRRLFALLYPQDGHVHRRKLHVSFLLDSIALSACSGVDLNLWSDALIAF